jgi:hypothetical protein
MRMKKIIPFILFGLIFSSCSGGIPNLANLIASPTPPVPMDTPTPLPTVTLIPTQDLFATLTATPVTVTPTETSLIPDLPTDTPEPLPVFSPQIVNDTSTYFTQSKGFLGVLYSNPILYWNSGPCSPRNIKMSVFVEDIIRTDKVFLFMRVRDKQNTLLVEEWSAGAEMIKAENGSYNYNIRTFNLRKYYYHKEAWLEYQFVAIDKDRFVIGRTPVYDRNLSVVMCKPVSSP